MDTMELEKQLSRMIRKRRFILAAVSVLFLLVFIISTVLLDTTKEVIQNSIIIDGIIVHSGYEYTQYQDTYIFPIVVGLTGSFTLAAFLLSDYLLVRFRTITKGGQYLTIFRGYFCNIVYANGTEKGRIGPYAFTHVVEV